VTHDRESVVDAGPHPGTAASPSEHPTPLVNEQVVPRSPAVTAAQTDEQDLTVAAALGDRDAFAELVRRCGPSMHRYAVGMLDADLHAAEDAVQEAFAKAWVALPTFEHRSSVRTWLLRITANEVHSARRRRRPLIVDDEIFEHVPERPAWEPHEHAGAAALLEALDLALQELPWRQRASWILREIEGLSYDEMAAVLDTSVTVVRGQLHRARATLVIRLEQWR
jgi:RNA polymerase sigma-70 factor, ECF subfamily